MKNIKIKRKTVMIGAAAVIALILAGVSAYAIGSGGNGFRTVVDETPVSITKADAEKIALENVKGATEKDITESVIDRDEAGTEYDIEILYDGYEYDFEIASDGSILDQSREKVKTISQNTDGTSAENVVISGDYNEDKSVSQKDSSGAISKSEAESIALAQVKGAGQNNIVKSERDHDDGRVEYDIEIEYGGCEYEFEIDGSTGRIISKDVDRDDD